MIKAEIKTTISFDSDVFTNLIVSAIEGGSNYWYFLPEESVNKINDVVSEILQQNPTKDLDGLRRPLSVKLARALMHTNDIAIGINDVESPETRLGFISNSSCRNALKIMHNEYCDDYLDAINGNDDAVTADIFFQLCVFGEVIYC